MIRSWILSLRLAIMKSTRLMAFKIAQSMPKSQQQVSYQGSTTWFCEKATLKKRIPKSLYWQPSIFEGSLTLTTKTIQKSQQQLFSPSIRLHQWQGPRRLQQRNVVYLLNPPPPSPSTQRSLRSLSCLIFSGFPLLSPVSIGRFFTKHT